MSPYFAEGEFAGVVVCYDEFSLYYALEDKLRMKWAVLKAKLDDTHSLAVVEGMIRNRLGLADCTPILPSGIEEARACHGVKLGMLAGEFQPPEDVDILYSTGGVVTAVAGHQIQFGGVDLAVGDKLDAAFREWGSVLGTPVNWNGDSPNGLSLFYRGSLLLEYRFWNEGLRFTGALLIDLDAMLEVKATSPNEYSDFMRNSMARLDPPQ